MDILSLEITIFIFPEENTNQFNKFLEKYGEKEDVKKTKFHKVSKCSDPFSYIKKKFSYWTSSSTKKVN